MTKPPLFDTIAWLTTRHDDMADVAQLVRALGCGPGGRGFKTHHSPHIKYLRSFDLGYFIWTLIRVF